ncbi:MAG: CBS domain-containing protein [Anaerolineaceae bacterium]|nr:CBS domain-containing protein [Anaerolineaceae bacterium]
MTTVRQVLNQKGYAVYSIPPQVTILGALRVMAEKNIGAVLVMDNNQVKGIFSERDYARRCRLQGKSYEAAISEVMTKTVYYIGPDDTMDACMAQMADKHIRHLPVVEEGKVIGVISIGDVVNAIISNQQSLISGLENYIMGTETHL